MTDHIIEIADTAARLTLENRLIRILFSDDRDITLPVDDVQCLILANPAVTISGALLAALASAGCMVLISGTNRLPVAMQLPLQGNYLQTERFLAQITASKPLLKRLWQIVVKEKILSQGKLLAELHQDDFGLCRFKENVLSGDPENMEAQAAKIYWKNLFCSPFCRDRTLSDNNILLNYGYAVLRAMTARACCAAGLHPTIGINHHNRYDPFCLADDLMEPFRVLVDRVVFHLNPENHPVQELTQDFRRILISSLLEKQKTAKGMWKLNELLQISANQVASSFQKEEIALEYF